MNYSSIVSFIDETINTISEAAYRENQKWNTLSEFSLEIAKLKSFLSTRIAWITINLGSFSACNSVVFPPLVITKINYNPATSSNFT